MAGYPQGVQQSASLTMSCRALPQDGRHPFQHGARSLSTELLSPCRKTLLEAAGFKFSRLVETRGVFSLVEAVPAPIPKQVEGSEGSGSGDVHINLKTKYLKEYGVISVNLDQDPEP